MSNVCPECKFDHGKSVIQKERDQERFRVYRHALRVLCKKNRLALKDVLQDSEIELFG